MTDPVALRSVYPRDHTSDIRRSRMAARGDDTVGAVGVEVRRDRLFTAEYVYRIQPRGSACRQKTSQKRGGGEQQGHCDERDRVPRIHTVQQAGGETRDAQAREET